MAGKRRVKPNDNHKRTLLERNKKEIRLRIYEDEKTILESWAYSNNTNPTIVIRSLIRYFISIPDRQKHNIIKRY